MVGFRQWLVSPSPSPFLLHAAEEELHEHVVVFLVQLHALVVDGVGADDIILAGCITIDTIGFMAAKRPLPVIFFRTASGNEPVREWLKQLPADERRLVGEGLQVLQYRWPLGMPLVDSLGDGLWEVRSRLPTRIARTLFFVHHEEIILLHGFIKKTQKTPTEDRALALKRKHAYIQNS